MRFSPVSDSRQKLLDAKNNSPLTVGERVSVLEKAVSSYVRNVDLVKDRTCTCTISSLDGGITVYTGTEQDKNKHTVFYQISKEDIISRDLRKIGANPFEENVEAIQLVAYQLDSILFNLDVLGNKRDIKDQIIFDGVKVEETNWNPFIYDKDGKKEYYQRPFVWNIEDNQLLIESIYQNIDCGKILIRKRGWKEFEQMRKKGETELAWNDVVDGKQRLNAIKCFMLGKFADLQGNYYSDLSFMSQYKFINHQLFSYAEMPENTRDEDVIKQFLKLNFTGIPQSKEHIDFVKSLQNKL